MLEKLRAKGLLHLEHELVVDELIGQVGLDCIVAQLDCWHAHNVICLHLTPTFS